MKWILLLAVAFAIWIVCLSFAPEEKSAATTPFVAMSSVSVPEMPAKAGELVHAASPADREKIAREVLRAVNVLGRPGVLACVVNSICRGNPDQAGLVVRTAIELQPDDILIFSKAAQCAAPSQVEQIVLSACQTAPPDCAAVAAAASKEFPSANNLILAAFIRTQPGLKSYMEEAEIEAGTNDFEIVMQQAMRLAREDSQAQKK
jgi:hypothetical protein